MEKECWLALNVLKQWLKENRSLMSYSLTGCSIMVVFALGEGKTRVQFPAPRPDNFNQKKTTQDSGLFFKKNPA